MWLLKALQACKAVTIMPQIGLRELKTHASEILRDVQDNRARYVVTKRGIPQAIIIPYAPAEETDHASREESWNRLVSNLHEVSEAWTSPLTAEEIIRDMRR
jgi:prevent-host-death family protein